jgi:hypothetical protein
MVSPDAGRLVETKLFNTLTIVKLVSLRHHKNKVSIKLAHGSQPDVAPIAWPKDDPKGDYS